LLGLFSTGFLWPPQVRKWLFFAGCEKKKGKVSDQDHTATIKQLRDEALVANQTTFTRFGTINNKIDQLMSDSELKNVEIQHLKSDLEHIKKMLVKNNEISDMQSEIHIIKEMLVRLWAHIENH